MPHGYEALGKVSSLYKRVGTVLLRLVIIVDFSITIVLRWSRAVIISTNMILFDLVTRASLIAWSLNRRQVRSCITALFESDGALLSSRFVDIRRVKRSIIELSILSK